MPWERASIGVWASEYEREPSAGKNDPERREAYRFTKTARLDSELEAWVWTLQLDGVRIAMGESESRDRAIKACEEACRDALHLRDRGPM